MNVLSMKAGMKTIKLISDAGAKLDIRIHAVACAGIAHFLQHGDTTLVSELVHAMPRSARGNALKFFITKHINVKWAAKAHNGKGGYVKNGETETNSWKKLAILLTAMSEPFYMKEDKEASEWNEKASVLALVAKLRKHSIEHALSDEGMAILAAIA